MAIVRNVSTVKESEKEIEPLALPLADPLGKEIETKTFNLFETADESIYAGTWETAIGESRWDFADSGEVIYVLSGRMTVTEDGAEAKEVGPGDLAIFPQGWKGTWNVTEPLKKVYVIYS